MTATPITRDPYEVPSMSITAVDDRAPRDTQTPHGRLAAIVDGLASVRLDIWRAQLAADDTMGGGDPARAFEIANEAAAVWDRLRAELDSTAWTLTIAARGVAL